jgi:hypothetical protein
VSSIRNHPHVLSPISPHRCSFASRVFLCSQAVRFSGGALFSRGRELSASILVRRLFTYLRFVISIRRSGVIPDSPLPVEHDEPIGDVSSNALSCETMRTQPLKSRR